MPIVEQNVLWMSWNIFLAALGMGFGLWFLLAQKPLWKLAAGVMWLLFVPNSIYMITDLIHLPRQVLMVTGLEQVVLVGQYVGLVLIAVLTYVVSMKWFEQGLFHNFRLQKHYLMQGLKRRQTELIMLINFLIAFGVVMGRVMRTNSWYVFTQPIRVLEDGLAVMQQETLWVMVAGMWLILNGVYFGWKRMAWSWQG